MTPADVPIDVSHETRVFRTQSVSQEQLTARRKSKLILSVALLKVANNASHTPTKVSPGQERRAKGLLVLLYPPVSWAGIQDDPGDL